MLHTQTLFKFLRTGLKSEHGNFQWEIGKWYKHDGQIVACSAGFHASTKIIDALRYVPGEVISQVEVRGDHIDQTDKQVWSEMRVAKAWNWTKQDSVALAVFSAELVIGVFEKTLPNDDRPRKAIEAAKAYLDTPSTNAADAARAAADASYAASYAATYASYAATYATYAAAYASYAAADAYADSAAAYATYASYAAADADASNTLVRIENWLQERITTLSEVTL